MKHTDKRGFRPFDAVDYLNTEKDIAAYLEAAAEAAAEDGDTTIIAVALGDVMRAKNVSALARETGLTRAGLQRALSPEGNPRLDTILKVAKAMGVRLSFTPA